MLRSAIGSLILMGIVSFCACDTSEAPQSPQLTAPSANIPKDKLPPTSKEDSTKNATAALDDWLKLLDQAQYATCWEQTGAWLKQSTPKDRWSTQIAAMRGAYGSLVSRKVKSVEYKPNMPGMPPGVYVVMTYDSSFANVKAAIEEVSATYEEGKWRPLGYYLSEPSNPTPTATPKA